MYRCVSYTGTHGTLLTPWHNTSTHSTLPTPWPNTGTHGMPDIFVCHVSARQCAVRVVPDLGIIFNPKLSKATTFLHIPGSIMSSYANRGYEIPCTMI